MRNNKWLFLCLILGSILVTGLISSIPIYSQGMMQRVFIKELEAYQEKKNIFPGRMSLEYPIRFAYNEKKCIKEFKYFDTEVMPKILKRTDVPVLSEKTELAIYNTGVYSMERKDSNGNKLRIFHNIYGVKGIEDNIEIVLGRMYNPQIVDNTLEVIVTEQAFQELNLVLDEDLILVDAMKWSDKGEIPEGSYKLRVVGIYKIKDYGNAYWQIGKSEYEKGMIAPYELVLNELVVKNMHWFHGVTWNAAIDYHKIEAQYASTIYEVWKNERKELYNYSNAISFQPEAYQFLQTSFGASSELTLTIWMLMLPILMMLIFYIFMVSQLIIMGDKNEISGLKSRGGRKRDIFYIYFLESCIIASLSLLIGPIIGLYLCKILGSSNGFLEFIGRKALPFRLSVEAYGYAVVAQGVFILAMLVPAWIYSDVSIVEHKQMIRAKKNIWAKLGVDFICLAICFYGYYQFNQRLKIGVTEQLSNQNFSTQPFIFLLSNLCILGSGLLFLRIYPYIIQLIFSIGKKKWSPVWYASLANLRKLKGQEQFIMLFMTMAMAIGIVSANEARTLNQNKEDAIRYSVGTDVVIEPKWLDLNKKVSNNIFGEEKLTEEDVRKGPLYIEPNFNQYAITEGVEEITKVIQLGFGKLEVNNHNVGQSNIQLMAITPSEFSKVAWFRNSYLPFHINNYLNVLAKDERAMLVSSNVKQYVGADLGDKIIVKDNNGGSISGIIYQFIDYWPGYTNKNLEEGNILVVANYNYCVNCLGITPYNIWIKKTEGLSDQTLYENLEKEKLEMVKVDVADSQVITYKNNAINMGINGVLTLGFILTMVIAGIGFIIYWVLSIKERALQFGVLRAMGLSQGQLFRMITIEQILLSFTSVSMGIIIGGITSDLFVPLLQLVLKDRERLIPFLIVRQRSDYIKIYIIITIILVLGMSLIIRMIHKSKVAQVIKLGED